MLKAFYLRIVPEPVRDWVYRCRHADSRWEHVFARQRVAIRAYMKRAATEHWFSGLVLEIGSGQETYARDVFQANCPTVRFLRSELSSGGYGRNIGSPAHDYSLYCDVTSLGIRDFSLDGIICSEVLEHVADYRTALDNLARVLKPGGKLLITCPFLYPLHGPADYWRFTPQAFELLLRDHFVIRDLNLMLLERGATNCPVIIGILAERK